MKFSDFFAWAIFAFAYVALLFAVSGCANQAATAKAGVSMSGGLQQDLTTIKSEAVATRPHADQVGQAHVDSLLSAVASAVSKLPIINAALALNDTLLSENASLKASFFSYRQTHDFWYTLGAVAIFLLVLAVAYFFKSFASPIGGIATAVFHFISLGIFWIGGKISSFIRGLGDKIAAKVASPSTV